MPLKKRNAAREAWIKTIPAECIAERYDQLLRVERWNLLERTQDMPLKEKRKEQEMWIQTIPAEHQEEQYKELFAQERYALLERTQDMPIEEKRKEQDKWLKTVLSEYKAQQLNELLAPERDELIRETLDKPFDEAQADHEAWLQTVPKQYRAEQSQILQEAYQQELSMRQYIGQYVDDVCQHVERMETIINEQKLEIEIPNQSAPEWTNFAADLISENEKQHGPANSVILEDILEGGTHKEASWQEIRDSLEYKGLMTWVLRKWQARNQYQELAQTIINEQQLEINIPDQRTPAWKDFADNLITKYKDKKGLSKDILEDILDGGKHAGVRLHELRKTDEYKQLLSRILRKWQKCGDVK